MSRYLVLLPMLALMVFVAFGMHAAACGMHASAVERMWRHNHDSRDSYVWSHAYCKFMSAPLGKLGG